MARVWTLVGLLGAIAVALFLVFIIESEISAKISELKKRAQLRQIEKALDECINNVTSSNENMLKLLQEMEEEESEK